MPNVLINNFNTGEVSELVESRSDISKYSAGCRKLQNSVPLVEGGAKKMPGTYFAEATALGGSMFLGSIDGTTLTVTEVYYGTLRSGQTVSGIGVTPGTILSSGAGNVGGTTFSIPGGDVSVDSTALNNSIILSGFPSVTVTGGTANVTVPLTILGDFENPRGHIRATYSYSVDGGATFISFYSSLNPAFVGTTITFPVTGLTNLDNFQVSIAVQATAVGSPSNFIEAKADYVSVTCPAGSVTSPYTGTGGIGTYLVSISQEVSSEMMQTASSGKSRLVPFQFSTLQGAFIEISAGIIRIWEGATQGSWSLGLALQVPDDLDYNPATAYVANDVVLIGPFIRAFFLSGTPAGNLYIAAPYGTTNASTVPITFSVNTANSITVTITGASPNQGLNIALANTTPANSAATLIQGAIRSLGSLNSSSTNYVDLTEWTVTPDTAYFASPWITAPTGTFAWSSTSYTAQALASNQNDEFPLLTGAPVWNSAFWQQFNVSAEPPIELDTPYQEADLFALDCSTQSADVLWIFHPSYPPAVVERLSANSWSYSLALPGQQPGEPAYRGTLNTIKTGYSGLGQSITAITQANPCSVSIAATTIIFPQGTRVYMNLIGGMEELNQGEFIVDNPTLGSGTLNFFIKDPNTGADVDSSGYVTYVAGGFVVEVVPLFNSTGNYPGCGTLYQQRLCVGGSNNNPTQLNGSVEGDYPDFIADPNEEDYAFQFTLVSNQVNQLLNMIGTPNALMIGTSGGVWIVNGSSGTSLSSSNVNASQQSSIGVSALQPQLVNGSAIFVSRSTRIVTFMVYSFVTNAWDNTDLTRLNRNITIGSSQTTSGIAQTAFQVEPYPIFWAVRNDGQLIGLVFNTQDQVYGWFRIKMESGLIESVAVVSGQDQEDQIAVVVNRTINGVVQRFVEYFMPQEIFGQLSNAFYLHSGLQLNLGPASAITGITQANPPVVTSPAHGFVTGYVLSITGVVGMVAPNGQPINNSPNSAYIVTVIDANNFSLNGMDTTAFTGYVSGGSAIRVTNQVSGMQHLIGQTVVAVGDGAKIFTGVVPSNGIVVFPSYANLVTIGLSYKTIVEPLNPVLGNQQATTKSKRQKFPRANCSLYQCIGGEFGTDWDHLHPIAYGEGYLGQQPKLYTGNVIFDLDADWEDEGSVIIVHEDPFPFTVRSIEPRMSVAAEG